MPGTFDQELQRLLNYLQSTHLDQESDFQGEDVTDMLESYYPDDLATLYGALEDYREEVEEEKRMNSRDNTDSDTSAAMQRYMQLPDDEKRIRFRQALVCFYRRYDPTVLLHEDEIDSLVAGFYLQTDNLNKVLVGKYGARMDYGLFDPRISINEEPPRHPLQPPS